MALLEKLNLSTGWLPFRGFEVVVGFRTPAYPKA